MPVSTEQGAAPFVPKERTLPVLQKTVQYCRGCDLYQNAMQAVFGELKNGAKVKKPKVAIMMIGEQPGDQEDKQGAVVSPSFPQTSSRFASHRNVRPQQPGRVEPHGQVRDEQACRVVRLSICEGVSRSGITAIEIGTARQAMCSHEGRTSARTGLLPYEKGSQHRFSSRHDPCRTGDISRCL